MIEPKSLLRGFAWAFLIGAAAIFSSPEVCAEDSGASTSDVIYRHNLIQVKILGEDLQEEYRVDDSGFINHVIAGKVKLAGLTVRQAEGLMQEKLRGDYFINPIVTITVREYSRFSILGEVRNPGRYPIRERISLVDTIATAGGFTRIANERAVEIIRDSEESKLSLIVDTRKVTEHGDRNADVEIQDGDLIVVPKLSWFRRHFFK
jgi:polysaccharide export outer membrane protein